jgi:hypothetical protein
MPDEQDDELTRRFKAVFNKDPVNQGRQKTTWKIDKVEDYDVDEDEVALKRDDCVDGSLAG